MGSPFEWLASWLGNFLPELFVSLIITSIQILIIVVTLIICVAFLTLAERKIIGYMQNRIGPNRVGPRGLLQPFADVIKLLIKEVIVPSQSNKYLYVIAPLLSLTPALATWAVIPMNDRFVIADINAGLLYRGLRRDGVYQPLPGWTPMLLKILLACIGMSAALLLSTPGLEIWTGLKVTERVIDLAGIIGLGAIVYFAILWLSGVRPSALRRG